MQAGWQVAKQLCTADPKRSVQTARMIAFDWGDGCVLVLEGREDWWNENGMRVASLGEILHPRWVVDLVCEEWVHGEGSWGWCGVRISTWGVTYIIKLVMGLWRMRGLSRFDVGTRKLCCR